LSKNSARRRGEKDKLYYDGERDESHVLQSLSVGCRVNNKPHATDTGNNLIPPPRHLFLLKHFVFVGDHAQITDNHRVVNVELVTIVEYLLKKYLGRKNAQQHSKWRMLHTGRLHDDRRRNNII
jgi:hypothetical protein